MNNIVTALPTGSRYSNLRPLRNYVAEHYSGVVVACYTPKTQKTRSEKGLLLYRASEEVKEVRMNILRPLAFHTLGSFVFIDVELAHCDNFEQWLHLNSPVPVAKNGFLYLPKEYMTAYQALWKAYRRDPWDLDFWAYVERELCIPQF